MSDNNKIDQLLAQHDEADVKVRQLGSKIVKEALSEQETAEFRDVLKLRNDTHDKLVALSEGREGTVAQARIVVSEPPRKANIEQRSEEEEDRAREREFWLRKERDHAEADERVNAAIRPLHGNVDYGHTRYNQPLRPGQSFVDLTDGKRRTVEESGEYLRAMMAGDWEKRTALTTGTTPGSYIVPEDLTMPLLDLARNQMITSALGVSVIPMSAGIVKVPVHTGDPAATWRSELGAVSESGVQIEQKTLTARSLDTMIRYSIEMSQDSEISMEQYLAQVFAQAFALTLDKAILFGTGVAPEAGPGVYTAPGVTVTALGANGVMPADYDYVIDLVSRLRGKNIEPSLLWSPRTEATMGKLTSGISGDKTKLVRPPYLDDIPILRSNQVRNDLTVGTSGAVCSALFGGRWSSVLVGLRADLRVGVLRERFADTGEMAAWGHLRADIQVARPTDLEVVSGIKAS